MRGISCRVHFDNPSCVPGLPCASSASSTYHACLLQGQFHRALRLSCTVVTQGLFTEIVQVHSLPSRSFAVVTPRSMSTRSQRKGSSSAAQALSPTGHALVTGAWCVTPCDMHKVHLTLVLHDYLASAVPPITTHIMFNNHSLSAVQTLVLAGTVHSAVPWRTACPSYSQASSCP